MCFFCALVSLGPYKPRGEQGLWHSASSLWREAVFECGLAVLMMGGSILSDTCNPGSGTGAASLGVHPETYPASACALPVH